MGSIQIVLIILGIAVLMILFKVLFRASAGSSGVASHRLPAPLAAAAQRMGSVAKQATLFTQASMLLVDRALLEEDTPRINASLFLAGAIDYLAQKSSLGDIEYLSVTGAMLEEAGLMTEGEAYTFTGDLPKLPASCPEKQFMVLGGEAVRSWLSGKDDMAPAKLAQYIQEWSAASVPTV
jgi:hypothetical protein